MRKIMVGISGGVDSATSCVMLRDNNDDVCGVNINFIDKDNLENEDAKMVCKTVGIPYYRLNLYDEFKEKVIKNFYESYNTGKTPNPCILCNKYFKFDRMYKFAKENGYDYIATGHYAKIEYSEKYNRYVLKKALNKQKDQSYFLYQINKDILPYVVFPLHDMHSKDEVRQEASLANLGVAKKKDSLDVCFIPDKDYKKYLLDNKYVKEKSGNVVFKDGTILGKHQGLFKYTIGQRKGLGISYKEPIYVIGFNHAKNELIVGLESDLYKKEILVSDVNLLLFDKIEDGMRLNVRIRYQGKDCPATLYNQDNNIKVVFDEPQKSPTSGQSAVFYLDDIVVGGGFII